MEIRFELDTEKAVKAFIAGSTAYGLTTLGVLNICAHVKINQRDTQCVNYCIWGLYYIKLHKKCISL